MIRYAISLFLVLTNFAFAQHIGNPGGGLPSDIDDDSTECAKVIDMIIKGEKKFVADHKKQYQSEKDFFKLLEQLKLSKGLEALSGKLSPNKCECENKIEADLNLLLIGYKSAGEKGLNCAEFKSRIGKEKLLEEVIDLYKVK